MKKLNVIVFLIITIFLFSSGCKNTKKTAVKETTKEHNVSSAHSDLPADNLLPLGFSKNGLFAYIRELNTYEGDTGIKWVFEIMDLVNDKVVYKEIRNVPYDPKNFRGYLTDNKRSILQLLKINQIELLDSGFERFLFVRPVRKGTNDYKAVKEFSFKPFPFAWKNDKFKIKIERERVILISEKNGTKVVSEIHGSYIRLGEAGAGALISPFEDRAAILLWKLSRLFEEENVMSIHIIGAHLSSGFKKTKSR